MTIPTIELFSLLIVIPLAWFVLYGAAFMLAPSKMKELFPVTGLKLVLGILAIVNTLLLFKSIHNNHTPMQFHLGDWFRVGEHYEFGLDFHFNGMFSAFYYFGLFLLAVIVKYAESYLHKEVGYHRFFLLMSIFTLSFSLVVFSDNIDVLFMGWEMIGVTSVLLVSFYEEREGAARNSLWIICGYKICDASLLMCSALAHYLIETSDIDKINSATLMNQHPHLVSLMPWLALLVVGASIAKAAQFPLTSWIVRAMEGPTPSSALYYGALSVSLGPFLLLKFFVLLQAFIWVRVVIVMIGALTAFIVLFTLKSRSDVKSILAYSSVLQISFIFIEIGLGFETLAMVHLISNGVVRVYQFLRSMNAIQDFYENPLFFSGAEIPVSSSLVGFLPKKYQKRFYYLSVNAFGLDWVITTVILRPWMKTLNFFNTIEDKILASFSSVRGQDGK